jgi:hypothetical protein
VELTPRRLNRALLDRQLLLRRSELPVADVVGRIVGLQAQEPASPYLALWNRIADFDASELDAAFADATVVKAQLMRITLHAVHAEDYPAFHNAMWHPLRASRLGDPRFTSSGLTKDDADALVPRLLEFVAEPRTAAEIEEFLARHVDGAPTRGVWWALRTFAPLWHVPAAKPWSFGPRPVYRAAPPYEAAPEELMPALLLGHVDRSRVIPPEHRKAVLRSNGDVLPTLLVDGCVAGVWRPVEGGIEATAFRPLPGDAWEGLAAEAAALVPFLAGRDPAVYRRYSRWWDGLPAAEVRVLPG